MGRRYRFEISHWFRYRYIFLPKTSLFIVVCAKSDNKGIRRLKYIVFKYIVFNNIHMIWHDISCYRCICLAKTGLFLVDKTSGGQNITFKKMSCFRPLFMSFHYQMARSYRCDIELVCYRCIFLTKTSLFLVDKTIKT